MAYYAFSAFDPSVGEGPLIVRAGVDPTNVDARGRRDRSRSAARWAATARRPTRWRETRAVPDRLDSAHARDQRRHRRLSADVRAVRPRARLRSAAAGASCGRHARRGPRCGRRDALHPERAAVAVAGPRRELPWPSRRQSTRGVFFDVDFTLDLSRARRSRASATATSAPATASRVDPHGLRRAPSPRRRRTLDASGDVYDAGDLRPLHAGASSRAMGGTRDGRRAPRRATSTTNGRPAIISRCTTMSRMCCASCTRAGVQDRADLEHASLPDGVSDPLRARGTLLGRRLVVRPRLHEAASEHLRGGAAPGAGRRRTRR